MSLLDKAKAAPPPRRLRRVELNPELFELVMAWVRKEVTAQQFATAVDCKSQSNAVYVAGNVLAEAIRRGWLKEAWPPEREANKSEHSA